MYIQAGDIAPYPRVSGDGKIAAETGQREESMAIPVKRIVTGHDTSGASVFVANEPCPHVKTFEHASVRVTELWRTQATPADNGGTEDAAAGDWSIQPPPGGSVFRVVEYPPDTARFAQFDRDRYFTEAGVPHEGEANPRHQGMHKTDSVDYAIILSGEIYAMMEEGEVLMKPGNCLVQRGTNHAWSNRTDEPCQVAFVLIDALPAP